MDYSVAFFEPLIGQTFSVTENDPAVALTLTKVTALRWSPRPLGGFSLEFIGDAMTPLAQGSWLLVEGDVTHEIFLVPVASDTGRMHYQAIFN